MNTVLLQLYFKSMDFRHNSDMPGEGRENLSKGKPMPVETSSDPHWDFPLKEEAGDPLAMAQRDLKKALPRRFYKEVAAQQRDGAFVLLLMDAWPRHRGEMIWRCRP